MNDENKSTNELIFIGGISDNFWLNNGKKLSRNYKQGYRVYDSKGISSTLVSQSIGGIGGYSGLYIIKINEGEWNDKL